MTRQAMRRGAISAYIGRVVEDRITVFAAEIGGAQRIRRNMKERRPRNEIRQDRIGVIRGIRPMPFVVRRRCELES